MPELSGRIALVTGASRGCGKGIATVLGEAGAKVYLTGRSSRDNEDNEARWGTIEDTVDDITARGGAGIAVKCDHADDAQVANLFAQIDRDEGGLDILVNNVWGGYENYDPAEWKLPYWDYPVHRWQGMFEIGVRANFVAAQLGTRMMLNRGGGLIVNITFWDRERYLGAALYDMAKAAVNRMTFAMARELEDREITVIALSPGWMRTEAVLSAFGIKPDEWKTVPDLMASESVEYVGRAVRALASDPQVLQKTGQVLPVGALAAEYGFTDIDGRRLPAFEIPEHYSGDQK